jgi:pimeloyl-ACP methyl ester carboxylesterase
LPVIKINGIDIFYDEAGAGTPILFVHGLGIDSRIFDDQIDFFKNKYRVIRYDLRGHGQSVAPETGYSYADFAGELKGLIEHLELKDFHLAGLSMGGAITARYVLENPGRARSITFIGAHIVGYYKFESWPNLYKIARKEGADKAREIWKNFRLFETAKKYADKFQALSRMVDEHSCALWLDPDPRYDEINDLKRIAEITVPALITAGKHDRDFSPIADILGDNLPDNRFERFETGHLLSFEEPERFNNILADFLGSCRSDSK